MTTEALAPFDLLAEAVAAVDGRPDVAETPMLGAAGDGSVKTKDILIINYSGELEKVWATMILASASAAMGVRTRVFVTFWGLQAFVKDSRRITGQDWMQKMMSAMQRPGVSHRKLSKMNFLGMGPWIMRRLAKRYGVASPKELLEAAQALGVEFIPCQMTMVPRTVDARGSFCPGPLMELIRVIRESAPGQVISVYSSDSGSRIDIPKWVEKAGHRLVELGRRDGYDEIIVEKTH